MSMTNNQHNSDFPAEESAGFDDLAVETLGRVQMAFVDLVAAVPGPTERASEIQRTLGLQKTLAWKLAKIVGTADSAAVFPHLPGRGAVEKILASALNAGVARERLDNVRKALAQLDALVQDHAGRRETADIMFARLSPEQRIQTELGFRKEGFRAASHIWGVQARTILRSVVVWPSEVSGMLDAAVVFGVVDLTRLRSDRSWVINRWRPTTDEGVPIQIRPEPIDPHADGCAPLLGEFCSAPLPDVQRVLREDLTMEDEVAPGLIGTSGAVTCYTGEVMRSVMPSIRTKESHSVAQNLELRTPCRTAVFDHIVHRGVFGRVEPRFRVYGELAGRPLYSTLRADVDELEVYEKCEYRGSGAAALRTPDARGYDRAVQHVCGRLGLSVDDFDVYRVRMEYPHVPVTLNCSYPVPEAPR